MSSVEPDTEWPRPPQGGYTADDLDRLPHLPPHTELIDGSLVFMSPQTDFHYLAIRLLEFRLLAAAPEKWDIRREMTVTLGPRNRPEPDLIVVRAEAVQSMTQTTYLPEDVALAIEVVSPESEERDRGIKPYKYAKAGIRHFWRVENDGGRPVVYVYESDPATRKFVATGIFHDRLVVSFPFPVEIDLTDIDKRRL
ncbi:Uma2 family endonuclease [Streptacidiphilus sp. N1-12]|uniref:Uma2 family endonuclease n=2 Tax=Streptacidiphilus alkalitolerans TaxID=3342712 RepID=A0ABV6WB20_9ACTN